jgi:hypothetical protein
MREKVAVGDREQVFAGVSGGEAPKRGSIRECRDERYLAPTVFALRHERPLHKCSPCAGAAEMKARQSAKIRELREALVASEFLKLDEQSKALGLSRSTTWTILKGIHKASGLSAAIIDRMLAAPRLPPLVRAKIHEYIEDKTAGLYSNNKTTLRKFTARLSITREARDATAADSTSRPPSHAAE